MNDSDLRLDPSDLLHGASADFWRHFDEGTDEVRLAKKETLFDQGDYDDRLFVLDEGVLEVSVLSAG